MQGVRSPGLACQSHARLARNVHCTTLCVGSGRDRRAHNNTPFDSFPLEARSCVQVWAQELRRNIHSSCNIASCGKGNTLCTCTRRQRVLDAQLLPRAVQDSFAGAFQLSRR